MKLVKPLKPYKFKSYDQFYRASMFFMGDKLLKDYIDTKRKSA